MFTEMYLTTCFITNVLSHVDYETKATARPSREVQQDLTNHASRFVGLNNYNATGQNGNAGITKPSK